MIESSVWRIPSLRVPPVALALAGLLVLAAALLFLPGRFSGDAQLQESTAVFDPALLEALETQGQVEVLISLKTLDIPLAEWTTELRRQNAAERAASVLSVLTPSDFTLVHQFEISAALAGHITNTGVEKLATHPDVAGVGMAEAGSWGVIEPAQLQEPTAIIAQEVLDILQTEPEVDVIISLKESDIPFAERTTELRRQNTAARQARVLSVLTAADFILTHQFEIATALAGRITESGAKKLAIHLDVASVAVDLKVSGGR